MMLDSSVTAIISSNSHMHSFEKKAYHHRSLRASGDNANFEDALRRAYQLPKPRF